MPKRKKVFKQTKKIYNDGNMSSVRFEPTERTPTGQSWINLSNKITKV